MNLLVTGGAGFIGSNFIRYWLKHHPDDHITNLDALTYAGNLENLRDVETNSRYRFVKGDIGDASLTEMAMKGIDAVINFAAESHNDRGTGRYDTRMSRRPFPPPVIRTHHVQTRTHD